MYDCDKLELCINGGWKCLHCGFFSKARHSTRALNHVMKISNQGIGICRATIPSNYQERYADLYDRQSRQKAAKAIGDAAVTQQIMVRQQATAQALLGASSKASIKRSLPMSSLPLSNNGHGGLFGINGDAVEEEVSHSTNSKKARSLSLSSSRQCSIEASFGKARARNNEDIGEEEDTNNGTSRLQQQDIRNLNNKNLEVALADFIIAEGLPFSLIESERLDMVIKRARHTDKSFQMPGRSKLSTTLLRESYQTCMDANIAQLVSNAQTFGLTLLGDGATIKKSPFINVLASTGMDVPVVLAVYDCRDHLANGGKKDAKFIARIFREVVQKRLLPVNDAFHIDAIFFDGASNVQKAGRILKVTFPGMLCFHGSEHVVSLFFDSVANIPVVKVSWLSLFLVSMRHSSSVYLLQQQH